MTLTLSLRPDVTVVAVAVENNAHDFAIIGQITLAYHFNGYRKRSRLLPPGQYEIVGLLGPQNERALRKLPDKWEELGIECFRATGQTQWYYTARECIREAIHSAGGDPELNWLIIKKIQ